MTPIEEVLAGVLDLVSPVESEDVPLAEALGRILAQDLLAAEDVPPFRNSAMDGYAVRSADVAEPGSVLRLIGDLAAGMIPTTTVGRGEALKIMTGAPMPDGADAVVRVEDTDSDGDKVEILVAVSEGTAVRPAGGDVTAGDLVLEVGTRLGPTHIGVLATLGIHQPTVYRMVRVGYMSTGDELAAIDGGPLQPGMIRDSNRPMIAAMLEATGLQGVDLGRIPDDPAQLATALERGTDLDAMVSSGGVSMGDHDVTKLLLEGGGEVGFWKVAIQPAKPFAFGVFGGTPFFGLPGNPVSAFVSYEQLVRPALLKMAGSRSLFRPRIGVIAGQDFETDPAKQVFLRVRVVGREDGSWVVEASGGQSSNVLSAAAYADGLAVVPVGVSKVEQGETMTMELIKSGESEEVR